MPAHFEPHYQINADLQLYTGISGESIDFPNRVAAEIDVTGNPRRTARTVVWSSIPQLAIGACMNCMPRNFSDPWADITSIFR